MVVRGWGERGFKFTRARLNHGKVASTYSLVPRLTQKEVGESDLGFPCFAQGLLFQSAEEFPLLCSGTAFPFCTRGKEILSKVKSSMTPSAAKT